MRMVRFVIPMAMTHANFVILILAPSLCMIKVLYALEELINT